jgi:hypothetical protein
LVTGRWLRTRPGRGQRRPASGPRTGSPRASRFQYTVGAAADWIS